MRVLQGGGRGLDPEGCMTSRVRTPWGQGLSRPGRHLSLTFGLEEVVPVTRVTRTGTEVSDETTTSCRHVSRRAWFDPLQTHGGLFW